MTNAASLVRRSPPTALAKHLEKLSQTIPGIGGESGEGPGGAGDAQFEALAYPASDIQSAWIKAARSSASALANKGFPTGKGRPGMWVTVGPSNALYPFTQFRSSASYVPNDYVAGGRTTALALAGNCLPGRCVLYAAPAGGGVWRTKNALNGQPNWQYLRAPFGINAVGSIAVDPNDPSGNTLWVGTGEANACGSGCAAGVGLYKSTDGGDTWTGPLGQSAFNARGVGSIVVKPGAPNTIYAASTRAGRGISSVATGGVVTLIPGAPQWGLYKSTDGGSNMDVPPQWRCIGQHLHRRLLVAGGKRNALLPRGVRQVVLDPADPTRFTPVHLLEVSGDPMMAEHLDSDQDLH